ncbi:MAG: hypothetical protein H7Y18_16795 [Clostridiaceae bacterium]|nr:hypothetical protein [Clostridiaceae bacterium]
MKIGINDIETIESLIVKMDINSIKRKGQVIFKQNHFCTQDLTIIKETIDDLLKFELNNKNDNT